MFRLGLPAVFSGFAPVIIEGVFDLSGGLIDLSARQVALDALRTYQSDFTAFLADANPFLSAASFESLIQEHTDLLVEQADSYAEGDFASAYATQREAWTQTGILSAGLAAAIASQFPDVFPDAAMRQQAPAPLWPAAAAVVFLAVLLAIRLARPVRAIAADRRVRGRQRRG